jgi:DNA-binding NarL/FixJ family response regulator
MIRVLIADDHAVVRAGLDELLSGVCDLEVVGVARDGEQAISLADETRPDVVLMDLSMPGLDGISATSAIRRRQPAAQVVALTSFADRDRILGAIDAGAIGYLLKDSEPEELIRGIRSAAQGDAPLAPQAARELIVRWRAPPRAPQPDLTDREREILDLVAAGHPNKVIALRLGIAEKTVKNHLSRIFQAIGVSDRTQAALWVRRGGTGETAADV